MSERCKACDVAGCESLTAMGLPEQVHEVCRSRAVDWRARALAAEEAATAARDAALREAADHVDKVAETCRSEVVDAIRFAANAIRALLAPAKEEP